MWCGVCPTAALLLQLTALGFARLPCVGLCVCVSARLSLSLSVPGWPCRKDVRSIFQSPVSEDMAPYYSQYITYEALARSLSRSLALSRPPVVACLLLPALAMGFSSHTFAGIPWTWAPCARRLMRTSTSASKTTWCASGHRRSSPCARRPIRLPLHR